MKTVPVGHLAQLQNGFPFDSSDFTTTGATPLIRIRDLTADEFSIYLPYDVPSHQAVKDGDLLVGMDGDFTVTRWSRGHAALNQRVCRLRPRGDNDLRFVEYSLPEPLARIHATQYATTVKHLSSREVLQARIPDVSPVEQRRIADFLDDRVSHIDRIIAARRQQAVLSRDATAASIETALDPSSGPGIWCRVRDISSKVGSGKTPRGGAAAYVDSGVAFLRSQNIHNSGLRLEDVVFISAETDSEMAHTRVAAGDVLLNITGGSLGRCCVVAREQLPANVSQHVCIIRPRAIKPDLLALLLRSRRVQDQIRMSQVGGNREGLNFAQVRSLRIWIPEDHQVLRSALAREAETAAHQAALTRSIELLTEYKQSLITAAVTGQLDVTTASTRIPE